MVWWRYCLRNRRALVENKQRTFLLQFYFLLQPPWSWRCCLMSCRDSGIQPTYRPSYLEPLLAWRLLHMLRWNYRSCEDEKLSIRRFPSSTPIQRCGRQSSQLRKARHETDSNDFLKKVLTDNDDFLKLANNLLT